VTANSNRAHPASQDRAGQAPPEAAKASSPYGDHPIARTCHGCRFLDTFKPRADERARYGFGDTGYGCKEPGYEGYVTPERPICVRGPYLRDAQ
jgi:hypothetical protein